MTSTVPQQPRAFAESWIAAWNHHDLDAVLAHFSEDFEFTSPNIRQIADVPAGRLIGKPSVRTYWQKALACLPDLRFELIDVMVGVDCLIILYKGHRGFSAEVFTFGDDGRAVHGQALYANAA